MIHVTENIYLDADSQCYIIYEMNDKTDKYDKPLKQNMKYYSNLESLCTALVNRIVRMEIQTERIKTVEELLYKAKETNRIIGKLISSLER